MGGRPAVRTPGSEPGGGGSNPSPPSTEEPAGEPIEVRHAVAGDLSYIYSTWFRAARDADRSPVPDDIWFGCHRAFADRVMADPGVEVLVAHPAGEPDRLLAYVVAVRGELIVWIHVREKPRSFRQMGLARLLMKLSETTTAPTASSTPLSRERLRNRYAPRKARRRFAGTARSSGN